MRFAGQVHLEVECPTGLRGTPPTLDCVVDGTHVLAVESKCTETFSPHEAKFSGAYRELVTATAHRSWQEEFRRLTEDPRRYRHLDAAQLMKHYLGLRQRYGGDRAVTLAYLFWEPTNADDVAACLIHAAEVREFARCVNDPRVQFLSTSYRALWEEWERPDMPQWLRDHAAALRMRYATSA